MTESEVLRQLMNGDRLEIWEAAKMLVAEANLESVPTLLELMRSSPSVERRVAAAWTLGFLKEFDCPGASSADFGR